ncbi:sialate O-acetylesterase [Candidatus Stoquefichus sp. SB1]|uniref:sialate O-acetylesterase n=1 Tax=Candidatus Stoquefichus sp. SB1 TaxID=1658109 RepID=UPI00067F2D1D|nr:sialate O-acetylesterase [Candidatus Stoquefichus sp. SB1]
MKSVLLIGQSNMAGRGFLNEVTPIYNENIFMLRNGRWQMMTEPIHFDRSVAGVGPAASFAQAWCNANKDEQIGLIPCAEGGSSIDEWNKEGALFRHAVSEAKFAMENSELIAILWHQGESDGRSEKYKNYYQKLNVLVNSFRKELGTLEIPFIVGGLGDYLGKSGFGKSCVEYDLINKELHEYAENNKNCYFVTGEKLYSNPDGIHINAESQRRFGIRYFEAYQTKSNIIEPLENEVNIVKELCEREYTIAEKRYITLEQFTLGKGSMEEVMNFLK